MKKGNAYLYLVITFFLWGSVYVAGKYALAILPTAAMTGARFFVAVPALFLIGWGRIKGTRIAARDWPLIVLIGLVGYFFTPYINTRSMETIGASMAALINSLNPVAITIMAALILKEKITKRHIFCLALALAGAVVITGGAEGEGQALGVLLVLGSVLTWSICSVLMRPLVQKYGALVITAYGMLISLLGYIPATIAELRQAGDVQLTWGAVLAILYMGLFATALAQTLWGKCLSMLEASRCSMFYPLQAFFSALLGMLFLDERFGLSFLIGAVMIAVGVVLSCKKEKAPPRVK